MQHLPFITAAKDISDDLEELGVKQNSQPSITCRRSICSKTSPFLITLPRTQKP
jgi:hypothetical protein